MKAPAIGSMISRDIFRRKTLHRPAICKHKIRTRKIHISGVLIFVKIFEVQYINISWIKMFRATNFRYVFDALLQILPLWCHLRQWMYCVGLASKLTWENDNAMKDFLCFFENSSSSCNRTQTEMLNFVMRL